MILTILRYYTDQTHTKGILFVNGKFFCHTLEDPERCEKIKGKTAIPDGVYTLEKLRKITPLTAKYRDRFDWFNFHWEVQNVPNFSNVYIHIGNKPEDTEGCILVGKQALTDSIGVSKKAFKELYQLMNNNDTVTLHIDYAL